jgi:protein-S-isoprenylcysteine O-methyltransferase Ste14
MVVNLVTDGIYAHWRHPIYVFSTLQYVFMTAITWLKWCWVPVVLLLPVQTWRACKENAALEAVYGETYRRWARTTWL